ncbi:MAG: hypothetical protein GY847_17765 [Proteobacteria bacterium]|nr:hypothetical protein [Pseudomonadota bacterium]
MKKLPLCLALVALLASACNSVEKTIPQPALTNTPASTVVPPTPAPTVSPDAQTWETGPVLVQFGTFSEDSAPFGVSRAPELLLYADGRLIVRNGGEFQEHHLTHQEMCALLGTIDRVGFFDLDMAVYNREIDKFAFGIVSVTVIEVNSWQSRRIAADALREVIDDPNVNVPDPLRVTYELLSHYQSDQLQLYQYDQLALTIFKYPADSSYTSNIVWPLNSPSLEELFELARVKNRVQGLGLLLKDDVAVKVYQAISQSGQRSFVENGVTYTVSARPLLPYESLESAVSYQAHIPSPGIMLTTNELTCYSTDDMLEIP